MGLVGGVLSHFCVQNYFLSFIKIGSVTAEILLTLSFCGGVVQSHFIVKPNLVLRLGCGFDNFPKYSLSSTVVAKI